MSDYNRSEGPFKNYVDYLGVGGGGERWIFDLPNFILRNLSRLYRYLVIVVVGESLIKGTKTSNFHLYSLCGINVCLHFVK